ncbi:MULTISPECIES: histidine kinase [unclassified Streptomyces]|uniref:sensor histidine kinase n=1 Tax=unclassified Streptomyces TaxID=2593676 RepID=UPI0001C1C6F8|nr:MULTISPECIES: histidine kinase [unclassified Streptomyces]AEN08025.1 integral membrane sensor signal transduction histidine kinase [Streptomyces sp. SirexAA-E]MYR65486.1 two-component sensor histidine kinase [Streptomyces sp. SID4939]MYR98950.1 two-component sensor histidine kinase [Streptomyces sp. SID4940]MYT62079.1 two-component sensor histidine kinase [Streptomyces sp. SID8357]MYT88276.1 two-component sensor histidine kinase [Streptomyces sp. SID8360]
MSAVDARDPDEFSVGQWPDWSFWKNPPDGYRARSRGRVAVATATALASLTLIARARDIAHGTEPPLLTALAIGLVACYGIGCMLAPWYGPVALRRGRVTIVAVLFLLGAAPAVLLVSPYYLTDLTYALAIGLMLLPLRHALLLGLATVLGQIVWMRLAQGEVAWAQVAILVGVTAALGTVFALNFTIGHLRAAREQVKRLAVNQERERVARDMHDVLGHSLSTMTVKLGLTRRILESTGDVALAVGEVTELETMARTALSDIRATVSDYRTLSLDSELSGARLALRAAGVRADLPTATDTVRAELREVFGYVVRETVTNVLRHTDAELCTVRLGPDWVEVTDNGSPTGVTSAGNGLTGLTERLAAVSGTLEHGPAPGGGFRVLARGPAPATDPAPPQKAEPT